MTLKVLPVVSSDFAAMRKFVNSRDGQLAGVAVDHSMPVDTDEAAAIRNNWSMQLQQEVFENDKSAHFMKAVDSDKDDEILALAHWHYYPNGYVPSDMQYSGLKDKDGPETYPNGLNVGLYKAVLGSMINERNAWTGNGPQWILTNIKTREPVRRKGAGGVLVQWGVDQAVKDKCPAYLEADAGALSLYLKHGFKPVGDITVDLNPYGIPSVYVLKKMVANQ